MAERAGRIRLGTLRSHCGRGRIIAGQHSDAQGMRLAHVLAEDDGFLFFRYLTQEREP